MAKKKKGEHKVPSHDNETPPWQPLYVGHEDIPLCLGRFLVGVGQGRFDLPLARKLLASYSLDFAERWRVATTELSQFQVDSLTQVFDEEREKFAHLQQDHATDIMKLAAKTVCTAFLFCRYFGMELRPELEAALCRRLVRRAVRRGALEHLHQLSESAWRANGRLFSWFWRHAMPPQHVAWTIPGDMAHVPAAV